MSIVASVFQKLIGGFFLGPAQHPGFAKVSLSSRILPDLDPEGRNYGRLPTTSRELNLNTADFGNSGFRVGMSLMPSDKSAAPGVLAPDPSPGGRSRRQRRLVFLADLATRIPFARRRAAGDRH
jgi:hypothetical protein